MSIQAVAWAIEQQEVKDPRTRWVLVALANYAGAGGENAFPAIGRLARDTGLSERTVQRHIAILINASLIRPGNKAIVAAYVKREDRRPCIYDLLLPRGVTLTPRSDTGCQKRQNGVTDEQPRGVTVTPDPFRKPVIKPRSVLQNDPDSEKNFLDFLNELDGKVVKQ